MPNTTPWACPPGLIEGDSDNGWIMYWGSNWSRTLVLTGESGAWLLTGYSVRFEIRSPQNGAVLVAIDSGTPTTDGTVTVTALSGTIVLTVKGTATEDEASFRPGVNDFNLLVYDATNIFEPLRGTIPCRRVIATT